MSEQIKPHESATTDPMFGTANSLIET